MANNGKSVNVRTTDSKQVNALDSGTVLEIQTAGLAVQPEEKVEPAVSALAPQSEPVLQYGAVDEWTGRTVKLVNDELAGLAAKVIALKTIYDDSVRPLLERKAHLDAQVQAFKVECGMLTQPLVAAEKSITRVTVGDALTGKRAPTKACSCGMPAGSRHGATYVKTGACVEQA